MPAKRNYLDLDCAYLIAQRVDVQLYCVCGHSARLLPFETFARFPGSSLYKIVDTLRCANCRELGTVPTIRLTPRDTCPSQPKIPAVCAAQVAQEVPGERDTTAAQAYRKLASQLRGMAKDGCLRREETNALAAEYEALAISAELLVAQDPSTCTLNAPIEPLAAAVAKSLPLTP